MSTLASSPAVGKGWQSPGSHYHGCCPLLAAPSLPNTPCDRKCPKSQAASDLKPRLHGLGISGPSHYSIIFFCSKKGLSPPLLWFPKIRAVPAGLCAVGLPLHRSVRRDCDGTTFPSLPSPGWGTIGPTWGYWDTAGGCAAMGQQWESQSCASSSSWKPSALSKNALESSETYGLK